MNPPSNLWPPGVGALLLALLLSSPLVAEDRLQLAPGDHVVFAGNTFAERMNLYGYLETALLCAYPQHRLVIRNIGWSADEVDLMPRSANTGSFEDHLGWLQADVVFLCFGMNESFAEDAGSATWPGRLRDLIRNLKGRNFGGKPPKLVLLSPIAHEDLGAPLPTADAIQRRCHWLARYTEAMGNVATEEGVLFVDLFSPTRKLFLESRSTPATVAKVTGKGTRPPFWTSNGIHLIERGYYQTGRMVCESLGLFDPTQNVNTTPAQELAAEQLRRRVFEKNVRFFRFFRPLNPYYIWGGRAYCWKKDDPMAELEQIGLLVDAHEAAIWGAPKPPLAALWKTPPAGREMWETPAKLDEPVAEKGTVTPRAGVTRNGVIK